MLNDDSILSIMTNMLNSDTNFEYWHYKNDPTHICFFSQATMNHLANKWGAKVSISLKLVPSKIGSVFGEFCLI